MEIRKAQSLVTDVIVSQQNNPVEDARRERAKATFDVPELSVYLNESQELIDRRFKLAKELEQYPWSKKDSRYSLTRTEEYVEALRLATQVWIKMSKREITQDDALIIRKLADFPSGLELHFGMFIPTILGQGTDEQKEELLPKCNSLQIIGTYAQTELGHGTFLRGLETTATFHQATDQFIIHSPTLTSTKWWPGGMGKTSTHAVVIARLFINGKDFGPHSFIVPLRDTETHRSLPGVEIGDIGTKFGYNGVDNGFMRFDHAVVPRSAMLARFATVTRDGQYVPPPADNQKATYSTMLLVRAEIVQHSAHYLAKAACIATRYCCVRRQTAAAPNQRELQVIDYENTAATLLPLIAATYVMQAAGRSMLAAYMAFQVDLTEGRFGGLPELHAISSGLKAVTSAATSDGIEAARRACGGHGYSVLSGLPTLLASYVQNVTWEGENSVMLLQAARFVLKHAAAVAAGQAGVLPRSVEFLREGAGKRVQVEVGTPGWARACFVARAAYLVQQAMQDVCKHPEAGGKMVFAGEAWNSSTTSLIAAARAHGLLVMLDDFLASCRSASVTMTPGTAKVLAQVGDLWAVDTLCQGMGDVLACGVLDITQAAIVEQYRRQLLRELRPNAIALVDSWAFTDYELNSALGKADGDVYADLLKRAKVSPLNATDEGPAWETVLKPAIAELQAAAKSHRSKL
eukprot:jgi/Ulvmu1/2645/UM014_0097.1